MARHRLSYAGSSFHGIIKDPFLIYKDSPLAWAIGIHSHYVTAQEAIPNRPSANGHKAWKTVQNHSLKYGVIIGGGSMFKKIEDSFIMCKKLRGRREDNFTLLKQNHPLFPSSTP